MAGVRKMMKGKQLKGKGLLDVILLSPRRVALVGHSDLFLTNAIVNAAHVMALQAGYSKDHKLDQKEDGVLCIDSHESMAHLREHVGENKYDLIVVIQDYNEQSLSRENIIELNKSIATLKPERNFPKIPPKNHRK